MTETQSETIESKYPELTKIGVGEWYYTKRGHLCRVEKIDNRGHVFVTSHYTGSLVELYPESGQIENFTPAPEPDTLPGTAITMSGSSEDNGKCGQYDKLYEKYPHIVHGSIYKVQKTNALVKEKLVKEDGRHKLKKKKNDARGETRCVIKCQTPGCKNTRDIKVQDAFQVKLCEDCKKKKRKKNLKKFLSKKKAKKK
jgi:hypothetical protein